MNTNGTTNNDTPNSRNVIVAVSALALIAIGIGASALATNNNTTNSQTTNTTPTPTATVTVTSTAVVTSSSTYKNGTYTAQSSYFSPGGDEMISITVKLDNGVVTDASVSQQAADGDSRRYQQLFAQNFKTFVVGKNIDSISLSRVSGSSLTSSGFNSALRTIKAQAKA